MSSRSPKVVAERNRSAALSTELQGKLSEMSVLSADKLKLQYDKGKADSELLPVRGDTGGMALAGCVFSPCWLCVASAVEGQARPQPIGRLCLVAPSKYEPRPCQATPRAPQERDQLEREKQELEKLLEELRTELTTLTEDRNGLFRQKARQWQDETSSFGQDDVAPAK